MKTIVSMIVTLFAMTAFAADSMNTTSPAANNSAPTSKSVVKKAKKKKKSKKSASAPKAPAAAPAPAGQ